MSHRAIAVTTTTVITANTVGVAGNPPVTPTLYSMPQLELKLGHDEHGIRTYYDTGDPPGRFLKDALDVWHRSGCVAQIVGFDPKYEDDLLECPLCGAVDYIDAWDVLGLDDSNWLTLFCFNCGREVEPIRLSKQYYVCPD